MGYVQIDPRGAELLFQIVTEREERASIGVGRDLRIPGGRVGLNGAMQGAVAVPRTGGFSQP